MNNFKQLWKALNANGKKAMAKRLLTSPAYLRQVAYGHRSAGKHMQIALDQDIEDQFKYAA